MKLKITRASGWVHIWYRGKDIDITEIDFQKFYKGMEEKLTFTFGKGRRLWVSRDVGSGLVVLWLHKPKKNYMWQGTSYLTAVCAKPFEKISGIKVEEGTCQSFKLKVSA